MPKWTEEEVSRLRALKAQGLNNGQVGQMLGRTRHAINVKLHKLDKGQGIRHVKAWSPQEVESLLTWRDKYRMGWDEIGRRLQRPSGTVYSKYKYLREMVTTNHRDDAKPHIPRETEVDWRKRQLLSPSTLTAAICGDPLPGYSALERRA